jgi:DNA-binding SARP family transcriptional activator/tetratricopeptide (TPR) repeat protein
MESPRYLRCLGLPALFSPVGEPIRFRTRKHLALLVYLAVEERRAHHREQLAELLWPGATTAEARHSLATALSVLRPRLGGDALQTTRDRVTLAPGRVRLDLDRLLGGDVLGSEITGPLEVANFLDGFDITDAGEFAIWKDRQQARLLPAIKDALVLLIDRCRRTGDSRQIERLADRMLALDELSEEAIRAKIEARAFAGDRVGALKVFEAWKEQLAEELGAAPSELIEGMAMRLRRRGWERTSLADVPSVPTDQWKRRPFVGRTVEHRILYEAWEGLRQGRPAHAFVLGDSGIGKTTLVERLTTAAALEGANISRVQCYDLERDIPYSTLSGLICGLLDRPGISATPPEALAEIARTVPEVRRRFPSLPEPSDSQGETARILLTEAFHQMLTALVEEHPVILVVDDLHLADEASLTVLHLVMRRGRGQAIMVLLLARPGQLSHSPQAARLRESESLGIREIELTPLSGEESAELLTALVPSDQPQPSTSIRRTLLRAAGGFPMVLELLTQDWQINGDQSLVLAVDAMTAELERGNDPTATYRPIIAHILRALDPPTHNVLNLAAVLGHRLNDLPMYGVIDLSLGQTMAGLSQLSEMRVLRDGSHGLEFVNELVRTAAYTSVPSSLRRALHSAVVDRLLNDPRHRGMATGLEIAWHCMRAGREQEAPPYLLSGAKDAIRQGAPDEAERALSSALPGLHDPEATEARFLLVEVLQEQGRWRDSLDRLAEIRETSSKEIQNEFFVYSAFALHNLGTARIHELSERLPVLVELTRTCPDPALRVRAARAGALILGMKHDRSSAQELLTLVEAIPQSDLDPDSFARLILAQAMLLYQTGRTADSWALASAGIAELESRGTANLVMVQLHVGLGAIRSREGQYEAATKCYENALKMAMRLGNDTQVGLIAGNIALCAGRLGRYEEQLEYAGRIAPTEPLEFQGYTDVQKFYSIAFARAFRGQRAEALSAVADLDRRMVGQIPAWIIQAWGLWRADILLILGRRQEALSSAEEVLARYQHGLLAPAFAGPFARWICLTTKKSQESGRATEILNGLAADVDQFDFLDQLEILCAQRRMDQAKPQSSHNLECEIQRRLALLPPAVAGQLSALEILS